MIRETASILAGILSAFAAFSLAFFYPGSSNGNNLTNSALYRTPIVTSSSLGAADQRLYYPGLGGVYSGLLPALILVLFAVATGFIVSHLMGARLKGAEI